MNVLRDNLLGTTRMFSTMYFLQLGSLQVGTNSTRKRFSGNAFFLLNTQFGFGCYLGLFNKPFKVLRVFEPIFS